MHTHSTSHFVRGLAVLAISLTLGACLRSATETFSNDSHASHGAEAAPTVDVTPSLDSDPPMPSEVADARIGLDQSDAPAQDQEKHSGQVDKSEDAETLKPAPAERHADHSEHVDDAERVESPKPAVEERQANHSEHVDDAEHIESPKPAPHAGHHHGH
jgi:hypothetical protein